MQVETYEIEEIKSSEAATMAADSEAIELIEKLGLAGQRTLVNTDTATRFPYPRMTKVQAVVFGAVFPARDPLSKFDAGIIPVRVLQVAAFCKDFPQTAYLEVWHTGVPRKDPILVGRTSQYHSDNYLLARWGDALESFDVLAEKAKSILQAHYQRRLNKMTNALDALRNECNNAGDLAVLTGEEPSFAIYG